MNIRSVSNPAQVRAQEKVQAERQTIKSDTTSEREANGQQLFGDGEAHRPLTEEEIERLLKKLKSHPGISQNNLKVEFTHENGKQVVYIRSQENETIRRFVEADLFHYLYKEDKEAMHLLSKTA
ncbi:MAG: hypothetical protein KDD33_01210 [Bdellovibrionales bacterium]|nr:hypothetical protein [Bdellovibrionales bacterium]